MNRSRLNTGAAGNNGASANERNATENMERSATQDERNATANMGRGATQNDRNTNGNMRNGGTRVTNFDNLDESALYSKIQELRFVKTELELYLDTHPGCKLALDYYYQTIDALRDLYERHSAHGAPLFASEVQGDSWSWVAKPWPWHNKNDMRDGEG